MIPIMILLCVVAILTPFMSAYAHTLDSMGDYRLELQWEVEPPYSGEVNAIKLLVSPMVPGLKLEEQPFQNGIVGLEDTLKIKIDNRDYAATLLLEADDQMPGIYRAYIKVLRPGYYQVNILGDIENTPISLSMHPHEVLNADHITFPREYGVVYEMGVAQERIQTDLERLAMASNDTDGRMRLVEASVESLADNIQVSYMGVVLGVVGVALGGVALYMARRPRII